MNSMEAFFLGLLQAIGEFLPISSSAHLRLFPYIIGKNYQGLAFDVILHVGTLFAIIIYFWRDWAEIIKDAIVNHSKPKGKKLWLIVIATIPAAIVGILLEKQAETFFRLPCMVGSALIFFSLVLYAANKKNFLEKEEKNFSVKDALIIGLFQSIAIIPGASRSAMTISGAIFMGYKRYDAARISFLMSAPIIFAAAVLETRKFNLSDLSLNLGIAFFVSLIAGLMSIKFLLNHLKNNNLSIFIYYRVILGSLVLIKYFFF